jgi:hypothetical protein
VRSIEGVAKLPVRFWSLFFGLDREKAAGSLPGRIATAISASIAWVCTVMVGLRAAYEILSHITWGKIFLQSLGFN